MVPCANLIGFSGQELAQKMPHVFGVLTEMMYVQLLPYPNLTQIVSMLTDYYSVGSVVEIVLFLVLLSKDQFYVVKAAILGSVLATMLLCLGCCFFIGGLRREEQTFSEVISETGSGLLLTA